MDYINKKLIFIKSKLSHIYSFIEYLERIVVSARPSNSFSIGFRFGFGFTSSARLAVDFRKRWIPRDLAKLVKKSTEPGTASKKKERPDESVVAILPLP